MPTAPLRSAMSAALAVVRLPDESATDAELLAAFAARRDEPAFAELVRRRGGLVRAAGRRLLADPATVEDVFQATFLLLARKAATVRWGRTVGPWLYQVAYRLAAKVRARSAGRPRFIPEVPDIAGPNTDPAANLAWADVRSALDDALAKLPGSLRDPLVLCYLDGLTRDEAATALGCSANVLKGRLERGRERLRRHLERRGLALPVALAGVIVAERTLAAAETAAVARAAVDYLASGMASPAVRALLPGMWGPMVWKFAAGLAGLVALGAVAAGLIGSAAPPTADPPKPPAAPKTDAPTRPAAENVDSFGDPLPPGAIARLGTTRFYHDENIERVIVTADGKRVAAEGTTSCKLWDGQTGRPVPLWGGLGKTRPAPGHFSLSAAGNQVVALMWDAGPGRVVDVVTGKELATLPQLDGKFEPELKEDWKPCAELAPDGKTLAVFERTFKDGRSRSVLRVWVADRWTELDAAAGTAAKRPLHFSADAKVLAYCRSNGTVDVWDLGGARRLLRIDGTTEHANGLVALSPDGSLLAHGDQAKNKVRVWDLVTGKERPELPDQPKLLGRALAFSPDGKTVAAVVMPNLPAPTNTIRLWDVVARKKTRDIYGYHYDIPQVAFAAGGKKLFVADGNWVSIWDPSTGQPLDDVDGHRAPVWSIAWSPDGKQVATGVGYGDNVGRVWDATSGQKVLDLRGHRSGIEVTAYSPDGKLLATGSQDGTARLWEAATGKELHTFIAKDDRAMVSALAFSPDGRSLVTAGAKMLHVWDVAERKETRALPHHGKFLLHVAFCSDGQRLIVWGRESGWRLINFATGAEEAWLTIDSKQLPVSVSSDGQYLAFGGDDGAIWLRDLASDGEPQNLVPPHPLGQGVRAVRDLTFSPDRRALAVNFLSGAVGVYELATASERFRFAGHGAKLRVAFSPDGNRLAISGYDRTVLVWDLTGERLPTAPPPKDLAAAWEGLAAPDAKAGFAAVRFLATRPVEALALLQEKLKPAPATDRAALQALLERLDSPRFAEREKASKELAALADGIESELREVAAKSGSAEVRKRVAAALETLEPTKISGDRLRVVRAVEALERIGNADARRLLETLARGAPGARLTQDAKATLARLQTAR